jgi:3-oxoadipate enol-lactonase/4-carboxymuconolactone decarboxylase
MARAAVVNLGGRYAARVTAGCGDAVFWIHPYTLDSTCWRRVWELLPTRRHVAIDLPGHGNSLPLGNETLPDLARQIGAHAIAQGARHLVALSLPTILALQIALEHPEAFASLVLAAPCLGGGPFEPDTWHRYRAVKQVMRREPGGDVADHWLDPDASLFRGVDRRPAVQEQLRQAVRSYGWWDLANDAYYKLWCTPQRLTSLTRVATPTLVLVGERDGPVVKQCAGLLQRAVAGCRHVELAGLGHLSLLEDPPAMGPLLEQHWSRSG